MTGGTGTRGAAGSRDRLAEQLAGLHDCPAGVLERALVAVAVTHRFDARGRCATCRPPAWAPGRPAAGGPGVRWRWRWHRLRARRLAGDCHTRHILRAALRDAADPGWTAA